MKKFIIAVCAIMLVLSVDVFAQGTKKDIGGEVVKEKEKVVKPTPHSLLKVSDKDMVLGNTSAKVIVIEYSSLNCPHCAKFHQNAFSKIKADFIDKGQVLYVYRDFPLNKVALAGSVLAHCAGKDKYFDFLASLFESQDIWAFHANYIDSLLNIAKLGGISEEKFKSCQEDKHLEDYITKRMMDAASVFQINSTPTFFINGEKELGVVSYEEFKPLIENALKKVESK